MTVQNTKLSGYNPNRQPASIPSYLGLPRISSWKKFANLLRLDTPNKLKCDCFCTGRSMVEMLGVLAIIGVLSIGAIAGYSKAMMKYRLNKTTDIASQLFATTFTKFAHDFSSLSTDEYGSAYLTPIMLKAGWVPDGLKPKENVPAELLDPFGNGVWIFRQTDRRIGIGWGFKKSQQELCYNFLTLSKSWAENLSSVTIDHSASPDGSVQRKEYGTFYGNSMCVNGVKCLADITIADMDRVCNKCEQSGCRIYFYSNVM